MSDGAREHARENARRLVEERKAAAEKSRTDDRLRALMESDPAAFSELMSKLAGKMLVAHSEGQHQVLTADERFLVLCAGRRWGKTKVGAAKALRAARTPKTTVWWVAPTYKVVKRGYAEVINQLPDGMLTKPAPPDSVFDAGRSVRLTFKNGSRIEFYSAERPEGMLGGSCDFAVLDEAATMQEYVWSQIIRPTLADRQGKSLFISTPRGRNWFYYLWLRGQSDDDGDEDFRSWKFPSRTNPTIPEKEFDDMKDDMPQVEYEQEVLAEFVSEAASVFRFPRPETDGDLSPAIVDYEDPRGHVILGVDLAKHSDWTVLHGINSHNSRPCYHDRFNQVSWPVQRRRLYDAVDTILQTADGVTIMVDSGGPGDVIYDDLEEAGYDVVGINFTTYKEKMVKLLASDLEQGRAFITHDQLSEFEHYSYSITSSGRWRYEALRGHDDEVSAALLAHWGLVHEGVPNVQTITSDGSDHQGLDDGFHDYGEADIVDDGIPQVRNYSLREPSTADLLNRPELWR